MVRRLQRDLRVVWYGCSGFLRRPSVDEDDPREHEGARAFARCRESALHEKEIEALFQTVNSFC
jgi:hypothetical protein